MKAFRILIVVGLIAAGCAAHPDSATRLPDREDLIPARQAKILPKADAYPPRSESREYKDPVPLPYPVNTAGAEDSAFILPDGDTLYFWFTPDGKRPVEEQAADGVTGIYVTHRLESVWQEPRRVLLQNPGRLALDGCTFVRNDVMWFC